MAKRMKEKNERNSSKLIFNIFIVLVFLCLLYTSDAADD